MGPKTLWTPTGEGTAKVVERLVDYDNQSSDSTETDGDESEEGESERVVEKVVTSMIGPPRKMGDGLYRHGLSGAIHCAGTTDGFLACGRKVSALMIKLQDEVHGLGSMCKVCAGYQRG